MQNHEENIRVRLLPERGKDGILQTIAEKLLRRETNWEFISHPGKREGTSHAIKGKIDTWFKDNDSYIVVNSTSQRERKKLVEDTEKGIYAIEEIREIKGEKVKGKVVLFCARDIDLVDEEYCRKLCKEKDIEFEIYHNSRIASFLLKTDNHDLVKDYLGYTITDKRPYIELQPVEQQLYNMFDFKFTLINNGDDILTSGILCLTRHFSNGRGEIRIDDIDLNTSIGANGGRIQIDLFDSISSVGGFFSAVTNIELDYIIINLIYTGSTGNEYKDCYKYSFLNLGSGAWNPIKITKLRK
ncbi:hypothetical protein EVU96_19960 [Bacillus infantis]|uniref:hypothetical protein n=1 Tax=Bacillus infantis TaxID=324767 RepID=UPI00101C90C1|nr:hypothetical protein [Bacillus infantis]RYI26642.1 hypothetical protein EVU96_19960 [Bacillus infantis]